MLQKKQTTHEQAAPADVRPRSVEKAQAAVSTPWTVGFQGQPESAEQRRQYESALRLLLVELVRQAAQGGKRQ